MNYIFEDIIEFNTREHCLIHAKTNDIIPLNIPGSNLLEYLIKNKGSAIPRDRLLDDIFKKNELVDSSSNLSQNLSMLRKGFRDLGIEKDILVTKPRVGVLLSDEVRLDVINDNKANANTKKINIKNNKKTMLVACFIFSIILLFCFFDIRLIRLLSTENANEVVNIDGCEVHIINKDNDAKSNVEKLLKKTALLCDKKDTVYYLDNDSIKTKFESLIHCRSSESNTRECHSYLYRNII
ncbi:winged helix-turn-helix domain-containing protein [Serratia odorifera]|uniref:winged helix-turn-helix domain-containing protein n=1 Tax=Serratia odorifera TaxID=618 RepID=UPI00353229C1